VRSVERAAANESTFREANEKLEEKAGELSLAAERTPYLCECEDERCTQVVLLTGWEYESVRAEPRRFVLAIGHQSPDDRLVQEGPSFTIIEKTGEEGRLVEERDPRS
jgi:hypothetical protein